MSASLKRVMKAAVFTGPEKVSVSEVAVPEPGPGELRVKLEGCGVCASNLAHWQGMPWSQFPMEPGAMGHEAWGTVDALGAEVSGFQIGDRVAALSYHSYAEFDLVQEKDAVKLPEALQNLPFPGEPLGCAFNIFRRSEISPGQTVAIVGIGFLGAILTKLANDAGARVIAISRRKLPL